MGISGIGSVVMQPWSFSSIPSKTVPSPPMQRVGSGSSGCAEAALLFTQQLPTARKGNQGGPQVIPILTGTKDALITALALLITLAVTVSAALGVRLHRHSRGKRKVKETILIRKS
jgi:hypothetical protein